VDRHIDLIQKKVNAEGLVTTKNLRAAMSKLRYTFTLQPRCSLIDLPLVVPVSQSLGTSDVQMKLLPRSMNSLDISKLFFILFRHSKKS